MGGIQKSLDFMLNVDAIKRNNAAVETASPSETRKVQLAALGEQFLSVQSAIKLDRFSTATIDRLLLTQLKGKGIPRCTQRIIEAKLPFTPGP